MKKKNYVSLLLLAAASARAFAQGLMPTGMTSLMEEIFEVFKGPFVKTILMILLCGCAVAYGFNKDNEKMKRNILAIGIAIAIICTASFIVEAIWDASQG